YMTDYYRKAPFDERHVDLFSRYFAALAELDGPMLIHCAAGKDRTGLLAALTHHVAGVHPDDIAADYLLTNDPARMAQRLPMVMQYIEEISGRTPDAAAVLTVMGVEATYLEAAFGEIEARFGGPDAYLERVLGVTPAVNGETRGPAEPRLARRSGRPEHQDGEVAVRLHRSECHPGPPGARAEGGDQGGPLFVRLDGVEIPRAWVGRRDPRQSATAERLLVGPPQIGGRRRLGGAQVEQGGVEEALAEGEGQGAGGFARRLVRRIIGVEMHGVGARRPGPEGDRHCGRPAPQPRPHRRRSAAARITVSASNATSFHVPPS